MIDWLNDNEGVGTWVSGIATVIAVILSIYLAQKQNSSKIKIYADQNWLTYPAIAENDADIIVIRITNVGFRDVVVESIFWKPGIFIRGHLVQSPIFEAPSDQLPKQLSPSKSATFIIRTQPFIDTVVAIRGKQHPVWASITGRTFRVITFISTGERFTTRIGENLRARIEGSLRR